ncbi:MAG: hypothetical protein ABSF64_33555 [Bryobacteraceae bacterium]|jgi:hypothetical protein
MKQSTFTSWLATTFTVASPPKRIARQLAQHFFGSPVRVRGTGTGGLATKRVTDLPVPVSQPGLFEQQESSGDPEDDILR